MSFIDCEKAFDNAIKGSWFVTFQKNKVKLCRQQILKIQMLNLVMRGMF